MSKNTVTRREALGSLGALVAGAPLARGQGAAPPRLAPYRELVNLLEFEEAAKLKLDAAVYATIAGGDRQAFDRIILRPRMLVSSSTLDLTTELLGEKMFAPILLGPIAQQRQYHPEGELATVRGAAAAKATIVISSRSSEPIERIAEQAKSTLWYQVYSERDTSAVRAGMRQAIRAGCKAICITTGTGGSGQRVAAVARPDWRLVDALRQGIDVPVLLKGVMTPEDSKAAVDRGLQGVVVSNGGLAGGRTSPIDVLPSIVDAVAGKVPVLVDGSFRRGTDVIKALALGAKAVMLGRPPMWGLAAYGSEGVRHVIEMLQSELARTMINVGKPTIALLDRNLVKIHAR